MSYARLRSKAQCFVLDRRATGAVEFAFLAPALILMALLTIDLGLGGYGQMQVQTAAQSGADFALYNYTYTSYSTQNIINAVDSATANAAITASPAPTQFYGCANSDGLEVVSSGSTCSNGQAPGVYVSVYSTLTYTPLAAYFGVAQSYVLNGQATVRVQ